ncbi:hypothetical protein H5154_03315 [Pseudoalteromonas sp. SR44-5]|uniref:hypothetical protein n=1 Tax=Pseudoalteromonas sp. SR44-5 TaxID=2760934 RepID=UPI001603891A|nr:hypothetical protein [Pseudoalteromonas sp. SR44-5]MBB1365416.1 hypothetical protein [Pseudoalteromonas sp. SR44-5]
MLPIIATTPSLLTTITNIAATIGPTIVKHAPMLLETAGKHLPQIIKTVETVATILNIISPSERAEDLGAKAMSTDKKPEDFDKFNDYIDYLRDEVKVDKTSLSEEPEDVMARQIIGTSLLLKGTSETLGTELTLPFIKTVSVFGLNASLIVEVVNAYGNSGLNLDDFEHYIAKTLPINQLDKHSDALVIAYQNSDAKLSLEQAEDAVMDLAL